VNIVYFAVVHILLTRGHAQDPLHHTRPTPSLLTAVARTRQG